MTRRNRVLLASIAVAVFLLLLAAPFFAPGRLFAPQLELAASERLGERVRIDAARLFILPLPHISISKVTIGEKPFLRVEELSLTPRLSTLMSDRIVLRSIELRGVQITQRALAPMERWTAESNTPGDARVVVEQVLLQRVDVRLSSVSMLGIDADVQLSSGGALASAAVRTGDGRLRLSLVPTGKDYLLSASARDWRLPVEPGIRFAELNARGKLDRNGLNLEQIEGSLYEGKLTGAARLGWKKDWSLSGRFELKRMNVEPFAALYTRETTISGHLDAAAVFESASAQAGKLVDALRLESDFELHKGMLHKVDLAAAASLLPTKSENKAGVTRFDRFDGQLSVDPTGFHFSNVRIVSGVLDAKGYVSIAPDKKLSGRVETAVKGTGSLVGTPLAVSGTVDSPLVFPTKGTLAGAAAGTLLLGPGIGTTLGIKAGQLTERLFGRKSGKSTSPDGKGQTAEAEKPRAKRIEGPTGGR